MQARAGAFNVLDGIVARTNSTGFQKSLGAERCLTEVREGERLVAGVVHDEALRNEHAFIELATAYAVLTLDNGPGFDPGGPSELGSPATASLSSRSPRSRPAALGGDVDCGRSVA
jgi:hypothetical protein